MIFEEIRFQNLFPYFGERVFDLRGPTAAKNIALITGRNGHGKTSFITGLKLLFGGVTEELLSSVLLGRKLTKRSYLLGTTTGVEWQGVFNRRARAQGQTTFGVRVLWREETGQIEAERRWLVGSDFEEELVVRIAGSGQEYTGESAQRFLGERLPLGYQRFFFFAGEQIQTIFEAHRAEQPTHAEYLLRITPFETLRTYLGQVVSDWRREAAEEEQWLEELEKHNRRVSDLERKLARSDDIQKQLSDEIKDLERSIRNEEHFLESMRGYSAERDEKRWIQEAKRYEEEIRDIESWLARNLPAVAPLVLNPDLVSNAALELSKLSEVEIVGQKQLLDDLLQNLQIEVFDRPPFPTRPLNNEQRRFLKQRLDEALAARIRSARTEGDCLFELGSSRARALLNVFRRYQDADSERRELCERLNRRSMLRNQLAEVERRLHDVSQLGEVEREEYRRRRAANNERLEMIGEKRWALRRAKEAKSRARRELERARKQLLGLEGSFDASSKARRKVAYARKLQRLFEELKSKLRSRRRRELEEAMNICLNELLDSHAMVNKVMITEELGVQFFDHLGAEVGIANISAGMKQLVATAFLWALKEVSGKSLPIVVDMPLARLDRQHQDNMLQRFFPKAAEQVIILPTNSELTVERYEWLKPHIYREYRLLNRDGDNTCIVEEPMYPEHEAANG